MEKGQGQRREYKESKGAGSMFPTGKTSLLLFITSSIVPFGQAKWWQGWVGDALGYDGGIAALYSPLVCSEERLPDDTMISIFLFGHVQVWKWMFWTEGFQGEKMKRSIPVCEV